MNYINDNQTELELTEEQYEDIVKLLGLALSPKQVYTIHKEYSKIKNSNWTSLPITLEDIKLYHKVSRETLSKYTYNQIEDIWNGALL